MYLGRLLIAILVGGVISFILLLSAVDFSVVELDVENQFAEADYLRDQAEFKEQLARRKLGDAEAPIKFTLYTGFACDGCKDFYQQVFTWLRFNMIDKGEVYFEQKFYPLVNLHPESLVASQAALCAAEQGDYYTFHNLLFEKQDEWKQNVTITDYLIGQAKSNRYREPQFRRCMLSGRYEEFVKLELADAVNKGVTGAPTVILEYGEERKVLEGIVSPKIYEQEIKNLLDSNTEEEIIKEESETEESA